MKKVCIVTATRAEYGLLRWTIDGVQKDSSLELQLVVTGTHLDPAFGETWKQIAEDGYPITAKVNMGLEASRSGIVRSMSRCMAGMADVFEALQPDLLVVLGDRYELLPICSAATVMGIPVAHIAGGERTEGAIDNEIRNAVTMLSALHFPNSEQAAEEVCRMLGSSNKVFNVGEPCVENYLRLTLPSRQELASTLGLDECRRWILCTLHPETRQTLEYNLEMARALIKALLETQGSEIVVSSANADHGGAQMNALYAQVQDPRFHLFPSLGQRNYLGMMKEAACVVGNSSSGVIETPFLGTPTLNIGLRQEGRRMASNIVCCDASYEGIRAALHHLKPRKEPDAVFGDGHTSQHIIGHIKSFLYE